jgi:hypothetical protein
LSAFAKKDRQASRSAIFVGGQAVITSAYQSENPILPAHSEKS